MSADDPEMDAPSIRVEKMDAREMQETADVAREAARRRVHITRQDLERVGLTSGCRGCQAVLSGKSCQGHSEDCSVRMEREPTGYPRARHRESASVAKALEKEDRNGPAPRGPSLAPNQDDRRCEGNGDARRQTGDDSDDECSSRSVFVQLGQSERDEDASVAV